MTDLVHAAGAFATGMAMGAAYIGLLWASVRLLVRSGRLSAYLPLAILRGALVLAALWLAATLEVGAWSILLSLAGFVTLRFIAVRAAESRDRKVA